MSMIGRQPARAAMTADDIGNNTIDSNKIINSSIVAADIGALDASVMTGVMPVGVTGGSGLDAVPATPTNAADIGSGVMPVGVTGGSGLTALGTVTSANLSNTAIVQPASSVLRVHSFTSQKVNYNTTSNDFVTSGTGTSFTTLANTTSFVLNVKGHTMAYENSGDLPTGIYGLFYHSSASATGQTPSGAQIGGNLGIGGYSPSSNTGRWDLYLLYHFLEQISCSGSTTYTIQVCGKKSADDYYLNFENTGTGTIMELSG